MEHVPDPISVIKNINDSMSPHALYIENFIRHDEEDTEDGPDLKSARIQRENYYKFLNKNFNNILNTDAVSNPNQTRIWQKI